MKPGFAFQWHITDECDQRCKHCYIFAADKCKALSSMSWDQIEDTFYNCLDFCEVHARTPFFYLTGGDPILHPDFWRLLGLFNEHRVFYTIMGNPFHLDDGTCREMARLGCRKYQMSLDGLRDTHDWFRKPGSFDETLAKIACINDAGMKSVIMSTISKTNCTELPGIIDAVVEANVHLFAFSRYVPSGGEVDAAMTPGEYRETLLAAHAKFAEYEARGAKTIFARKDHLWTLLAYELGEFRIPDNARPDRIYGGCNCANCHLTILPSGDVYACRRAAESKVGNALEDRLADLWVTTFEEYRDYAAFEKCSRCKLLRWCRGCPAVARGTSGSFFAADPQCWASEENGLLRPAGGKTDDVRVYTREVV